MLRLNLTFFLLAASIFSLNAQTGVVLDAGTLQALSGATVYAINNGSGAITDEDGLFNLSLEQFPDTLIVSYLGYEQEALPLGGPGAYWEVRLKRTNATLPEIIVNSYRQPQQISEQHKSINDFLVLGEQLLLLTYFERKPHYRLSITDQKGNVLHTKPLEDGRPEQLFQACLGGLYLIYPTHLQELTVTINGIQIQEQITLQDFRNTLRPCLYANDQYVFPAYHRQQGQIFQLFATARDGSGSSLLETIVNEEVLRHIEDEEHFLENKARTVVETDIKNGTRVKRMIADERRFAESVLYRPVRVQLFPYDAFILLFDYTNHRIRWLDTSGNIEREIPIVFHRKNPYKVELIQDEIYGRFYVLQADNKYTYLHEIDPRTGQLNEAAVVPEIYLKRVQIREGKLFYLHKGITFEERWQYLYRVDLK